MNKNHQKLKLAIYWGAACGGCCVSVLDLHENLLEVIGAADLVFWPIALDIKYNDVKDMPDGHIDVTLFNGAIRNSENEYMAMLLRKKSKILVGYGSCAQLGGIPGLANLSKKKDLMDRIYLDSESTHNPSGIIPQPEFDVPEGKLDLPIFFDNIIPLDKLVCVDYYIPGCPPEPDRLLEVFRIIANNEELPSKKSVVGAYEKTQCDDCTRKKTDNKKIKKFYRPWEIEDDGETCFLEQGVICMGPATRGGCGYRCIEGNAPCRGCYGPPPNITDPGAKMLSSIATMIDSDNPEEIKKIVEDVVDPAGTFYRFSVPASILRRDLS